MIIRNVKVKPIVSSENFPVKADGGLKYAVVFNKQIVALFGCKRWAEIFIEQVGVSFNIREVSED